MKQTIELNPDGTFPEERARPVETTTFTATSSYAEREFMRRQKRKKTWKEIKEEVKKDVIDVYFLITIATGTGYIIAVVIKSITWLFKYFL